MWCLIGPKITVEEIWKKKKNISYSYSGIRLIERTLIDSDVAFHMYSILGRSVHMKYDVWNGLEYNLFIYAIFAQTGPI